MKLYHTMLRVKDLEASLTFYQDFLGLSEVRRHEIGDEATLVFLSDEARNYFLELTYNKDGREYQLGDQFGHLAFLTPDLEPVMDKVKEQGLWFRSSRPEMNSRYIFIKDPSGYDIEILEDRKP